MSTSRFIQQQIPPMTTRQVPEAPCPACPQTAVFVAEQKPVTAKKKVTAKNNSKPTSNSKNKK